MHRENSRGVPNATHYKHYELNELPLPTCLSTQFQVTPGYKELSLPNSLNTILFMGSGYVLEEIGYKIFKFIEHMYIKSINVFYTD